MCHTCDRKGYFSSKCTNGRGPTPRGHQQVQAYNCDNFELPARPASSYHSSHHQASVSHLPASVQAGSLRRSGGRSQRTGSSSGQSGFAGSIVSTLSADSLEVTLDEIRNLQLHVNNLGARYQEISLARKQLAHKTKKIDEAEYEQQLNSPSNLVLYEQYKQTESELSQAKAAAVSCKRIFSHTFSRAKPEHHFAYHEACKTWVNMATLCAERRIEHMQMFPFTLKNKEAIEGHLESIASDIRSARTALVELEANQKSMVDKIIRKMPVGV